MPRNLAVVRDAAAGRFVVRPNAELATLVAGGAKLDAGLLGPTPSAAGTILAESGIFSLTAPGVLTMTAAASTPTSADYREPVRTAFDSFLAKLELLEGVSLCLGATALIRRLLANQIPSTFPESLYFQYGYFNQPAPFRRYVDLQPGMRLRLECQFSQLVPGGTPDASFNPLVNGYVPAGQAYYQVTETIGTNGKPLTSLDAFFGAGTPPLVSASAGGAGGVVDLASTLRKRWLRICYPAQFPASDAPGAASPLESVTLIGADTLTALQAATDQYFAGIEVATAGAVAAFFRGRTYAVPELLVFLNNTPYHVPLGTTVRQLFGAFAVLPRMGDFAPIKFPYFRFAPVATLLRANVNPEATYPNPYRLVSFEPAKTPGPDAFDLPVFSGDTYSTGFPSDADNNLNIS